MAKKHKKTEAKRAPTKRQLSRVQQQKKIQRIILISGSVFFALIIALGIYGIYAHSFKNLNEKVLKVNDTVFKMDYYVDVLEIFLEGADSNQVSMIADYALDTMLQNELIIQGAPELGVSATSDEVNNIIDRFGQPNTAVYRDMYKASILTEKLLDDYFSPELPDVVEHAKVEALVVETLEKAEEVKNVINTTDNISAIVEMFTVEPVTGENNGDLGWLPKGMINLKYPSLADSKLEDIVLSLEPGVFSDPVYDPSIYKNSGYWIIEVLEKDEDKSVHARGILLGSIEEAMETKARLEGGDDFIGLVKELSQHQESKDYDGDLGWLQKGFGNEAITNSAFELEPGAFSDPIYDDTVSSKGGYWFVKVVEKDMERQVDEEIINGIKEEAFGEWLAEQHENSQIEEYLNGEQKSWAIDKALRNIGA